MVQKMNILYELIEKIWVLTVVGVDIFKFFEVGMGIFKQTQDWSQSLKNLNLPISVLDLFDCGFDKKVTSFDFGPVGIVNASAGWATAIQLYTCLKYKTYIFNSRTSCPQNFNAMEFFESF